MGQYVAQILSPSLEKMLVPSLEDQKWWQQHLTEDEFSQAPHALKAGLKQLGEKGKQQYRAENRKYSTEAAAYKNDILKKNMDTFRKYGKVAHIGGGTGLGLGYAPFVWKSGGAIEIWDLCQAGLNNSKRRLIKICRRLQQRNYVNCGWSLHIGDIGTIFTHPQGIDVNATVAAIAEKVEQHRSPDLFVKDCRGMGTFISNPEKFLIFAHPFGQDNPGYQWNTSHPYEREAFVKELSDGAQAPVEILDERPHMYFDQHYTFFTVRRVQ